MLNLPNDLESAIRHAKFAQDTVFWPRLLVRFLENVSKGRAFVVSTRYYRLATQSEQDASLAGWLDDLIFMSTDPESIDTSILESRSSEIWHDTSASSSMRKTVSRLTNALRLLAQDELCDYESELTRSLSMMITGADPLQKAREFDSILNYIITYR